MKEPKIHYSGGFRSISGGVYIRCGAGYPCCASHLTAEAIRMKGSQSPDPTRVTCKKCMSMLKKHDHEDKISTVVNFAKEQFPRSISTGQVKRLLNADRPRLDDLRYMEVDYILQAMVREGKLDESGGNYVFPHLGEKQ